MVRGVSGLRSAAALLEVGSLLTMYRMGLAERDHPATPAIYADEWGVAPRRNLRKCRYYRRGKWLTPPSQIGMAAGSLDSWSNECYFIARPA